MFSKIDSSNTHLINTTECWEIRGKFSIQFSPGAQLFRLRCKGVRLRCGRATFAEAIKVEQHFDDPHLTLHVPGMPDLVFPHEHIVAIFDDEDEGVEVWR